MFPYFHVSPFRSPGTSREEIAYWRPSDDNPSVSTLDEARIIAKDRATRYGQSYVVIRTERHSQTVEGWSQASGRWVGPRR